MVANSAFLNMEFLLLCGFGAGLFFPVQKREISGQIGSTIVRKV
jgi:hypothetical protein